MYTPLFLSVTVS